MIKINEVIIKQKEIIDSLIEKKLNYLRKNSDSSLNTVLDSMEYSLKAGGKRIRPILTIKVAKMLDGNIQAAYDVGIAIELIHTYSLIHDDLPVMDDDDYRRGQLSNHKVFGEGMAVLAGDALLTLSFELLSDLNLDAEKKIKIIKLLSNKAGFMGMVGGQTLDIKFEDKNIDLETLIKIHRLKTGALFKAAILGGAYCGQPTNEELDALEKYADNLGLLFQITDDILDKTSNFKLLGKEIGSDEKSNKSTYVNLLGLEESRKKAKETAESAKKEIQNFSNNKFLINLIDYILKRDH